MKARRPAAISRRRSVELARSGRLRGAAEPRVADWRPGARPSREVELRLVLRRARCARLHADALCELDAAARSAALPGVVPQAAMRVEAWRAELAYFQGRYSAAEQAIGKLLPQLTRRRDWAYAAFALRIRIAILLARAEYDAIEALAQTALRHADASGDSYVIVQVLNILGAARFDRATSKLAQRMRDRICRRSIRTTPRPGSVRARPAFLQRAREVAEKGI